MRTRVFDDLTFGDGTVAWAPDGSTIALVGKDGPKDAIVLWDLYDKKLVNTLSFDDIEIVEGLDWAPDSRRLAFVGTGYGQSDLYMVDVATEQVRQLTGTSRREDHPDFHPDGRRLAFSAKVEGQFDIKVYDLDTGSQSTLVATPGDDLWPEWTPEGDRLLFVSTREGINDLFLQDLSDGREYRLTRTLSGIMNPSLSPDGQQLVLNTYYHSRREMYRMDMPTMPELRLRSDELAARVGAGPVVAAEATEAGGERPSGPDPILLVQKGAADTAAAALAGAARLGLEEAVAILDRKADTNQAMKLAEASGGDAGPAAAGEGGIPSPTGGLEDVGDALRRDTARLPGSPESALEGLPRRRYTPKLEFDGVALQMGYYSGFLAGVAQLSMSDLLGNHDLNMFTDYVGSQEINNDFTFAAGYSYHGRRPTYSAMVFNWNQYFNDNEGRGPFGGYYGIGARLTRGLVRSRQTGVLADMSYPLDVYRRVELSYSFVDEQREIAWPVQEPIDGSSTHLFKAAYVHDSLNIGLLGPTAGRRYYLSAGRTLALREGDRNFTHVEVDYRHYLRLGRWSVLGLRGSSRSSIGPDALSYNLGGPAWFLPFYPGYNLNVGPLRGYAFSKFTGTRVALVNGEIRVPFIRNITFGWPGTFAIPAVDGAIFADLGSAWKKDQTLDPWPLQSPHVEVDPAAERVRLQGGVGFGLLVYFLAPLNFEFARRTDFKDISGWHMHFSFGRSF